MQLYCPSCKTAFGGATHCPKCGGRLLSPQESFIVAGRSKKPPPDAIAPTFGGRVAVGIAVAFGIVFGLRELLAAIADVPFSTAWTSANSQPDTFAIRLFAILAGGLLAGAGRHDGALPGLTVGAVVGGLLTIADCYAARVINDWFPVCLAVLFPLVAGLAGMAGTWLWPADAILPEPKHSSHGSSMLRLAAEDADRRASRPTNWTRITIGAVLVAAGIMASDPIRGILAKYSGGLIQTSGHSRGPMVGLQIATITTLVAGMLVGATTGAGLWHGLLAGVLAAAGLLIGSTNSPNGLFPPMEGLLALFDMPPDPLTSPRVGTGVLAVVVAVTAFGGWLGGQLFPPLAPRSQWKRKMVQQS